MSETRFEIKIDGAQGTAKGLQYEARPFDTVTGVTWVLQGQLASAVNAMQGELISAAAELLTLLDDYMVVTSLTANERYGIALERFRKALPQSAAYDPTTQPYDEPLRHVEGPARDETDAVAGQSGDNQPARDAALKQAYLTAWDGIVRQALSQEETK